jgi:arginine utilization protein RocB
VHTDSLVQRTRLLAERLIATPSVSPDPAAESACAGLLREALPGSVEHGLWPVADGRAVVWARLRGTGEAAERRTALVLGHYDTVGVAEYATLQDPDGPAVAFDPARLRARFIERAGTRSLPEPVLRDVLEETREPGTWLFGRGALDMKAALAAGVTALEVLAADPPEGDVWFIATPDEEHESAGMFTCVERLAQIVAGGARFVGALNLDYGDAPALYCGVMGKLLGGVWVAGVPAHASEPVAGVDAAGLAAELAVHLTGNDALAAVLEARPALLRLRDRKEHYDAQTAGEAEIQVNLMFGATAAPAVLAAFERAVEQAVVQANATRSIAARAAGVLTPPFRVSMHRGTELAPVAGGPGVGEDDIDVRERTLRIVRDRAVGSRFAAPAVVAYALPPFYPASMVANGPLAMASRRVCTAAGIPEAGPYPHISDISYLRWSPEASAVAAAIPSFGGAYRLPVDAMTALDMDVINLGPWGHDAHGLYERVRADHAFEVLPGLIERIVREGVRT